MPPLRLRVWSADRFEPDEVPLPLAVPGAGCSVRLRCLPGASGIHLVISDGDAVRLRAEIPGDAGETVAVQVEVDGQGGLRVWSRGRNVLLLPSDSRYDPIRPIQPAGPETGTDLVIIVDGTVRHFSREEPGSVSLLERKDLWTAHVEKLITFAKGLHDGGEWRAAVLAFGDQELPEVKARDLFPLYHLRPAKGETKLQPLDFERLRERLLAVSSTPGGDFVDALADALEVCADLRWRDEARKLVVLSGDSPGHSVLFPLRKGADLCARENDVDTQALELHRQGVEIVTIYHAPPAELGFYNLAAPRDLLLEAQAQYFRLASMPTMAFEAEGFDPEYAANEIRQRRHPVARGVALGELLGTNHDTREEWLALDETAGH